MKKKLLILEINECDFQFIFKQSKKYNFDEIVKYFKNFNLIKTNTKDNQEGLNLDPWVQWVSVHTSKISKKHKVYRIGQKLPKNIKQIWEIVGRNVKCTLWGLFNSNLRSKKNIDIFFPDPWSFTQEAYPKKLEPYLKLPRYFATSYINPSKSKFLFLTIKFFLNFIFSKNFFFIIRKIKFFIKNFFVGSLKSFNLYFMLDLISMQIVHTELKKNTSDLSIISLNSFAHFQHNFWDEQKYFRLYLSYLNEVIKIFKDISLNYDSVIIYNGFSQRKIKTEYHLIPKKFESIFNILKLHYQKIEPNMSTGATIFFKNFKQKHEMLTKLNSLKILNNRLIETVDYKNKKKIFLKFNLVFYKKIFDISKINNKNINNLLRVEKKLPLKQNQNMEDENIVNLILSEVVFMKSTSRHKNNGILYYNNFSPIENYPKNKIENHILGTLIKNYFITK